MASLPVSEPELENVKIRRWVYFVKESKLSLLSCYSLSLRLSFASFALCCLGDDNCCSCVAWAVVRDLFFSL